MKFFHDDYLLFASKTNFFQLILTLVFHVGVYDRMLEDQKRFGKSAFEIVAQERLYR